MGFDCAHLAIGNESQFASAQRTPAPHDNTASLPLYMRRRGTVHGADQGNDFGVQSPRRGLKDLSGLVEGEFQYVIALAGWNTLLL